MAAKKDERIKIILLGDSAVGKTNRPQQMSTFALTLFSYDAEIDGKKVPVDFWDTAGQERFNSMHPSYYYNAHCCILVFDVTRKVTYMNLNTWYKELQDARKGIPVIVVANKIDVDYKVTERSFAFAGKKGAPFFFASASDGTNVVQIFEEAIKAGMEFNEKPPQDFVSDVLSLLAEDWGDKKQ
ncbi:rab-related GTPase [Planoprotostelium fungivorum]|uniref:Rab-related GTPase n=1 Tax=Planoprotostelium fungivorum TaxID=1890364 RepID=A0A2P6NKR2_9EUKA|nr:rab-related GTPase [Planoprotostelium fungivorum]